MSHIPGYYGDLRLKHSATGADIVKAHRTLALEYHLDKNLGREADVTNQFQKVQIAYETLIDPVRRGEHD
ncbi:hypothetical protein GQ44DRAFT_630133, partial [Phaeosphaeriaceae sp. PMI808]